MEIKAEIIWEDRLVDPRFKAIVTTFVDSKRTISTISAFSFMSEAFEFAKEEMKIQLQRLEEKSWT
jgi:hypothetical protein